MAEITLFDTQGRRKYINASERKDFIVASKEFEGKITTLCHVLAYTGCRLSEALNLKADHIDLKNIAITFETLKKRQKGKFRQIPIPEDLLTILKAVHNLHKQSDRYLWANRKKDRISRTAGFKQVKRVFEKAGIEAPANQPKALRHGFAIHALQSGIPLNQVSKWLGHSSLTTTAIYANALGEEERNLAAKMWENV